MSGADLSARLSVETARMRERLTTLTRQATTGQRTDRLGDLAPEVPRALTLRAGMQRVEAYDSVLTQVEGRTTVMQAAMGRMLDIAREFRSVAVPRLYNRDPTLLNTARVQAQSALNEIAHLLNTRHAGEYVFAGSDITNPPIPDPGGLASGQMAQDIAAEVANLGVAGAAATLNATRTVAQSNAPGVTPFSAFLQAQAALPPADREGRRATPAADGEQVPYGIFADRNAVGVSTGETTGSWVRDLMRNLMSVAALDPAQMTLDPEWPDFVAGLRNGFESAERALAEERGGLGQVEARIESQQLRHRSMLTALRTQVAQIEEVDLAATIERLQATKLGLEASYRALSSISDLTLARFLR
jgi:flagellin-like hook-associated protein FlgL